MPRKGKTTDDNRKYNRVKERLKRLKRTAVEVGYFRDSGEVEGISLPEIAAVHEFGSSDGHTPERSFLRSTFDERKEFYQQLSKSIVLDIVTGRIPETVGLAKLSVIMVGDVKKKITTLNTPPNAQSTINIKGYDNPLIDTGNMRAKTSARIRRL